MRKKKKLTLKKLESLKPCADGLEWYKNCGTTDLKTICEKLLASDHYNWANWVLVRLMTKKQKVRYAVFAAECVLEIFEKRYPDDKRPCKAIQAAKRWIKAPTVANKKAAYAAASDAADAAAAADAADADAADAAAAAAAAAADAAAAYAAAYAAAARNQLREKIVKYGLGILAAKKGSRR